MTADVQEVYQEDTQGRRYHVIPISQRRTPVGGKPKGGEIKTINLNTPITRKEFNKMSDDSKRMYIQNIHNAFGCTQGQLSQMLGFTTSYFNQVLKRLGIGKEFKRGYKPTAEQRALWQKFINSDADELPHSVKISESTTQTPNNTVDTEIVPTTKALDGFSFSFEKTGNFNPNEILGLLKFLVPDGKNCSIKLSVEVP